MNPFKRLPGYGPKTAAGLERQIWRRLPAVFFWGTVLPLLFVGLRRWLAEPGVGDAHSLLMGEYIAYGLVAMHWTLLLTVAMGCLIVMVMKGPGFVADAYPPADRDTPFLDLPPLPDDEAIDPAAQDRLKA